MNKLKLTIAMLAFACSNVLNVYGQPTPPSWKEVPMSNSKDKDKDKGKEGPSIEQNTRPNKSSQRVIWPEVYYDQAAPSLYVRASGHSLAADYYIRSEEGELVADGTLTLEGSSFARIDLSGLPHDTYMLVIVLGGVAFEAEITTE